MENYGIRIAQNFFDATKDSDNFMHFTTKESTPKAINWEEINIVSNPTKQPHKVKKIPFLLPYGTADGANKVLGHYLNIYDIGNVRIWASASALFSQIQVYGSPPNKRVYLYVFEPEISPEL